MVQMSADTRKWITDRRERLIPMLLVALILVAGSLVFWSSAPQAGGHTHETGAVRQVAAEAFKEQYGIQVTLVAVTAAGGMVDFRFRVLDAAKAQAAFDDHANMPVLRVAGSDVQLAMAGQSHSMVFQPNKVYYLLYGNAGGAVRPGSLVTVRMGGLQLEPIAAR